MASSSVETARNERVVALVDRLIVQHVGVSETSERRSDRENFKLCKEYCDYHLNVHRYRDLSEDEVFREVETLCERMEVAAQDAKGAALRGKARTLSNRWRLGSGADEDTGWRVVLMLLRLSRRPLSTPMDGGGEYEDALFGLARADVAKEGDGGLFGDGEGALAQTNSADDEEDRYSASDSTLSVWSDEENENDNICVNVATVDLDEKAGEDATDPEFSWRDSLLYNENVQPVLAVERSLAKVSSEKTYVPEIIAQARNLQTALRETNASRSDAELLAAVMPKALPNETSLVHGALHALRVGDASIEHVSLPHVSATTVNGALASVRDVAAGLAHLQQLSKASFDHGPTIQAFAQALGQQAQTLKQSLVPLEQRVFGMTTSTPTILELRASVRRIESKASILEQVARDAFPVKGTPAAEAASHCLSTVYDMASDYQAIANSEAFAITLSLFIETIQPYLQGLHRWLSLGVLDDPAGELFVARGRASDDFVGSKEHWLSGFVLRHDIEIPSFLRDIAPTMLDVGRSLELLHHTESAGLISIPTFPLHLSECFCRDVPLILNPARPFAMDVDSHPSERAKALIRETRAIDTLKVDVFSSPVSLVGIRSVSMDVVKNKIVSRPTRVLAYNERRTKTPMQDHVESLLSWLSDYFSTHVPSCPMSLLVEKCLVHHIHKRAQDVQFTLASHLRDKLDVKHELNALRSLFLGGAGDAATQFYDAVFAILDDASKIASKWNETTLNELLVDAFVDEKSDNALKGRIMHLEIIPEAEDNIFSHAIIGTGALEKLASLRYTLDIKWPHNIVIPPSTMAQYNQVTVFLTQLRLAHASMQKVSVTRWTEHIRRMPGSGMGGDVAQRLEPRLRYFVSSLREYLLTRILQIEWDQLMRDIDKAPTLEAIRMAHEDFLNKATSRCLVSPDPTWTLLAEHIRTILAVACEYAACQTGDGSVSEDDATRLSKAFEEAYTCIVRVLQAKLDLGSAAPEVEDLLYTIKFR